MRLGEVRSGQSDVAKAMAAARSARNQMTRSVRVDEADAQASARRYKRTRARDDRERERAMNRRFRVQVPERERPRTGNRTPHKLFYRLAGQLLEGGRGTAMAAAGTRSIHFAVVARGFASTTGRRWRSGEGERAASYIVREGALEGGEAGWWSNIADDRNELVAFHRASEAIEKHDRANANVYVSEIISLPASLSPRQRRRIVRRHCRHFETQGLPYTAAMHLPDGKGDGRNFHCHIIYSLRPARRLGRYDWNFAASKLADVNTPTGIRNRRRLAVDAINATLRAAGSDQRYTDLSNRARGLGAPAPKVGQKATWLQRRIDAVDQSISALARLQQAMPSLRAGLLTLAAYHAAAIRVRHRLQEAAEASGRDAHGTIDLVLAVRARVDQRMRRPFGQGEPADMMKRLDDVQPRVDAARSTYRAQLQARWEQLGLPGASLERVSGRATSRLTENQRQLTTAAALLAAGMDRCRAHVREHMLRSAPSLDASLIAHVDAAEHAVGQRRMTTAARTSSPGVADNDWAERIPTEPMKAAETPAQPKTTAHVDARQDFEAHAHAPYQAPTSGQGRDVSENAPWYDNPTPTNNDAPRRYEPLPIATPQKIAAAAAARAEVQRALQQEQAAAKDRRDRKEREARLAKTTALRERAFERLAQSATAITRTDQGQYKVARNIFTVDEREALFDPACRADTIERIKTLYELQQAKAPSPPAPLEPPRNAADKELTLLQQAQRLLQERGR